jgi:hypothetical protein
MNTHAHRPLSRQQESLSPLGKFTAWVNTKWQAHRARRREEETVACLSGMDIKLLNDIGMDLGKLEELANPPEQTNAAKASRQANRRKAS